MKRKKKECKAQSSSLVMAHHQRQCWSIHISAPHVRPRYDRVVSSNVHTLDGREIEMREERRDEYLHLEEGEAPADAGVRTEGEGHEVGETRVVSGGRWEGGPARGSKWTLG